MTIQVPNHQLTLLPEKAILCQDTLILADTHFGKSASFRSRGIPVPEGDTKRDTQRILDLLEKHQPQRFVIAGDFLHARESKSPEVLDSLSSFFAALSCPVALVLGNHDLRAVPLPSVWPVTIHDTLDLDDLLIVHDPEDAPSNRFSICGHLHPVARIRDGRNTGFRTPCFWLRQNSLILPSFGTFTGGAIVHPEENDRLFTPLHDKVVELPHSAL